MPHLLFVCTGNICRSPIAEGIMRVALAESHLDNSWSVDSAGIHAVYGLPPAPLAIKFAARYGADIAALRSRPFGRQDFITADHIFALDLGHLDFLRAVCPAEYLGTISLLPSAAGGGIDVPDPYGRSRSAFATATRLIATGIGVLLGDLPRWAGAGDVPGAQRAR